MFEDTVNHYNKWTTGMAAREIAAQQVTIKDLFNQSMSQFPNQVKLRKTLPFPLTTVTDSLGQIYVDASNALQLFETSLNFPLISENTKAKLEVEDSIKKLKAIIDTVKHVSDTLDKIID
jgi:hypothetical protein